MKKNLFVLVVLFSAFLFPLTASAVSDTWSGGGNSGEWGSTGNWVGGNPPGTGDTATFNSAGNAQTTIDLAGQTVNTVVFDTASAAAYTIGVGGVGVDTLTLNNGGSIVVNAGVVNAQIINANVTLLGDAAFTNNAANASGGLLTVAGTVTGAAGVGTLTLSGSNTDANTVSGNIVNGAAALGVTKSGVGTWVLSGTNTYTGATTVSGGTLKISGTNANDYNASSGFSVASGATLEINQAIAPASGTGCRLSNVTGQITGAGTFEKTGAQNTYLANNTGGGERQMSFNMDSGALVDVQAGILYSISTAATNKSDLNIESGATASINNGGISTATNYFDVLTGAGTLTLDGVGSRTLVIGVDNGSGTFSGTIDNVGTLSLTKQGSGTQTLSGTNTYTGTTTINAGTLELSGGAAISNSGAVALADVASATLKLGASETIGSLSGGGTTGGNVNLQSYTLTVNEGGTATYAGILSGATGAFTKGGLGTVTLSGNNTHDGLTTVSSGTLILTGDNSAAGGGITMSTGELDINHVKALGTGTLTLNGGTIDNSSAGALTLTTNNAQTWGGDFIFKGTRDLNLGTGAVLLGAATRQVALTSGTLTVGGVISGSGGLTKAGAGGNLVLSGSSDYTGATNVNTGTLTVNGSIASSSLTTVASGATIAGSGTTGALTINGTLSPGASPGTLSSTGAVSYGAGGSYTWEINDATGSAGTNWDLHAITGGLTIDATSGNPFTINITSLKLADNTPGDISSFNKTTNYSWTIATASGGISGFDASDFTLDTSAFTNAVAGTFGISVAGTSLNLTYTVATPPNPIYWQGTTDAMWNEYTGGVTNWVDGSGVEAAALPNSSSDVHFSYTGAGNLATTLGQNFTINTLTMDAGSSAVSISGNTLTLNGSDAITIAATGGALTINSAVVLGGAQTWLNNSTTNDLTVAGNVTNGGYTLTVSGAGDTLISGIISGTGGITKTGTGTLELNGANAYIGATAINVGTVKLGHATGLGTTDAGTSVTSGAALDLNGKTVVGEAVTINGTGISSGGALLNSSASAASLSGMVTLGSASTITSSGAGGLTLTGGVTNGGFDVTFDGANATTVSTTKITGAGGLVKNGSGTLTLSAANDYTGTTTINAGTLELSGGSAIANAGAVSLANVSGAILKLNANETIGSLSGGGTTGGNVNLQSFTLTTGDTTNTSYGGVISGTGGLTKLGSGTFTLSNANTYSGTTLISAGTLLVSNATALGSGAAAHVTNGGTLDVGTTDLSVGGNYAQTGTLKVTANSAVDYGSLASAGTGNVAGTISVLMNGYIANGATLDIGNFAGGLTYDPLTTVMLDPLGDQHGTLTGALFGTDILRLTMDRSTNGFASDAAGDPNAAAVGAVLDNIQNPTGDILAVLSALDAMSPSEVATALATMTPDVSSGAAEGSRSLTSQGFTMVSNRLGGARTGGGMSGSSGVSSGEMTEGLGVWMQGLGSNMKQKERKGIEGYSANIFGTTIGADKVLDRHFRAGLAGSYGYANVKSKTPGSPSDNINSYQATLYGSYDSLDLCEARQGGKKSPEAVRTQVEDSWYVDGMLAFTQNNYDSRREIWVGSAKRVAKADHYGQQYSTNFETGYKFVFEETKDLEVTPFAGLGYNYLYLNKYKEKGADALNLHVEGEGFHQLEQSLGMKLAYPIVNKKLGTFIPSGKAAWLYDYIGDRFETTASFAGGGASFDTVGAKPAKSGMLFGAELAFLNKGNMTVTGNWDIEIKDEFLSNTYYGTVRYDF